jgi:hypothetical protein
MKIKNLGGIEVRQSGAAGERGRVSSQDQSGGERTGESMFGEIKFGH